MQIGIKETEMAINLSVLDVAPDEEFINSSLNNGLSLEEELDPAELNREFAVVLKTFHGEEDDDLSVESGYQEDVSEETCFEKPYTISDKTGELVYKSQLASEFDGFRQSLGEVETSVYQQVEEVLTTSEKDYSKDTLEKIILISREFASVSNFVAINATAIATYHRIVEGRILNMAKTVDRQVNGAGWEKRALKMFPAYSKSTRCLYMAIAQINGGERHCAAGTERMRVVPSIIKKLKVTGPDQIAEMFNYYGEMCDPSEDIHKYIDAFDRVLQKAKGADIQNPSDEEEILLEDAEQEGSSNVPNHDDESIVDEDCDKLENGEEDLTGSEAQDDSDDEEEASDDEGQDESGVEEDIPSENKRKEFLNQDSLNQQLVKVEESIEAFEKFVKAHEIPQDGFDRGMVIRVAQRLITFSKCLSAKS